MPETRRGANYWQDWVNLLLAAWVFISPWVLGYADISSAAWNSWIFGIVIAAFSIAALVQFAVWEEWVNVVLGLWLVISPWVLGFATVSEAMWNHVIFGLLIAAFALWDALAHKQPARAGA